MLEGPGRNLPLNASSLWKILDTRSIFVDKTDAIADLLLDPCAYIYFTRPRKFGKSLMLDIASEMLAAGMLPEGAVPWLGFRPKPIEMFRGLKAYEKLAEHSMLRTAHFVIRLSLGVTGCSMDRFIKSQLEAIAREQFSDKAAERVAGAVNCADALGALIAMVPGPVPVAIMVDEYEGAIFNNGCHGHWEAAESELEDLRRFLAAFKDGGLRSRVNVSWLTGITQVPLASAASGANHYANRTHSPLVSRSLGFSQADITLHFRPEVAVLGHRLIRKDAEEEAAINVAIAHLKSRYNGYCFDGRSECFAPYCVLADLQGEGLTLSGQSSSRNLSTLFGLTREEVMKPLLDTFPAIDGFRCNPFQKLILRSGQGLQAQQSRVSDTNPHVLLYPLLFQLGLLTLCPGAEAEDAIRRGDGTSCWLRVPNDMARSDIAHLAYSALPHSSAVHEAQLGVSDALGARDFEQFLQHLSQLVMSSGIAPARIQQEKGFNNVLRMALAPLAKHGGIIHKECETARGNIDILITLDEQRDAPHMWVIELGYCETPKQLLVFQQLKLEQAGAYAAALKLEHRAAIFEHAALIWTCYPTASRRRDPEDDKPAISWVGPVAT